VAYELLWYFFVPDDFATGLDFCFEICKHIACGHVPPSISCFFVATWLLVLGKQKRKTMVHGVKDVLDLHSEWVVLQVDVWNVFNLIFGTTFFQELKFYISTLD
jgi:hypothetical protein